MGIKSFILHNLMYNIKNYYLYVFALMMSVALYFSFVNLQYDPAMSLVEGSIKGSAAIKSSSVLLVAIVAVFLLYANIIFIKRRSKEIGLLNLIGLTKSKIFFVLTAENLILYTSSLAAGIFIGFSASKLVAMILFQLMGVDVNVHLHFSWEAFLQTVTMFFLIYLLIMAMNFVFIKRQTILSLFQVTSTAEERVKKPSLFQWLIGLFGLTLIIVGYYTSSKLFDGDFTTVNELTSVMIFILASVIIGTYFFFKGSVTILFNMIRKRKNGYLTIKEVLSISPIMFKMKSNALLLTVITTVAALAIGFMSLSYISYYSIEKSAEENVPNHFGLENLTDSKQFQNVLDQEGIQYTEKRVAVKKITTNIEHILAKNLKELNVDPANFHLPIVSDKDVKRLDVPSNQVFFSEFSGAISSLMPLKSSGEIELKGKDETFHVDYMGVHEGRILPFVYTAGGLPVAIVDDEVWNHLDGDSSLYIGIDIVEKGKVARANDLFNKIDFQGKYTGSQLNYIQSQKQTMGLTMFIVGFLGLTFLIVSGSILYFKQMDESEDEKPNYTILRKLGFSEGDLVKGIQVKQAFNFGIPLCLGLLHSYFAVKSGWFFFGTELWTPMIFVMLFYTALYSVFGVLSVAHYKKVIRRAL